MRHLIPPPDLGDILGVRVGDPLALIFADEPGGRIAARVVTVTRVDEDRVFWKTGAFWRKNRGACSYAMHDRETAHFYASANPEHIAEARRLESVAAAMRAEDEKRAAVKLRAAAEIGALLGDGERYTETYGEAYSCTDAADTLAARLSVEQLTTLCDWLGLSLEG